MASSNLIPAAIVIAGGSIGVGLYFGLAAQAPVSSNTPHPLAKPTPPAPTSSPVPPWAPPPTIAPQSTTEVKHVTQAAQAALAELKPKLKRVCWDPAIAETPEPAQARWTWDVTFDTRGVEIARGISDVRGLERADVADCLRRQPLGMRVPAPSRTTRVTLQLELP